MSEIEINPEYSKTFYRGQISTKNNDNVYSFFENTLNSDNIDQLVQMIKNYSFNLIDFHDSEPIMWVTIYSVDVKIENFYIITKDNEDDVYDQIDDNDILFEKHRTATMIYQLLENKSYQTLQYEVTDFLDNKVSNDLVTITQGLINKDDEPLIVIKNDSNYCYFIYYNRSLYDLIEQKNKGWIDNGTNEEYTDEIWNKKVEECKAAYGLETIKKRVGDTFNQLQIALKENQLKVLEEALKAEKKKSKESDENVKKGQSELEKAKLSLIEFETQNQIKKIQSEAKFQYKLSNATTDDEKNELNASHKVDAIRDIVLEQLERMKLSTNNELLKADAKKNINQQDKQEKAIDETITELADAKTIIKPQKEQEIVIKEQKAIIEDTRTKLADTSVKRINDVVMNALENVALTAKYENDIKSATADKNTIKKTYEKEKTELGIKQIKNEVTRTLGTIVPLEMKLKEAEENQITFVNNVQEFIVDKTPNENINDESKNIGNGIRFIELLVMKEMENIPKQIELHKAKKELEKFKDFNPVTYKEYESLQKLGLAF